MVKNRLGDEILNFAENQYSKNIFWSWWTHRAKILLKHVILYKRIEFGKARFQ